MESLTHSHRIFRFGVFEADLAAGELRKHGLRVKIQEQPFQILLLLLDRPGELITREELRRKLWAEDTFVDFDRSLNTALTKLRVALCDSAETPRFIETIPRHGYRFIAPVSAQDAELIPSQGSEPSNSPRPATPEIKSETVQKKIPLRPWHVILAACAGIALFFAIYLSHHRTQTPSASPVIARRSVAVLGFKNLTGDAQHAWLSTALSDWLSAELAVGEQLRVIPEDNVAHGKVELSLPDVEGFSKTNLTRIKQNLGSDLVVVGSFASLGTGSASNIRVDVRLQDTISGETIATVSETGTESRLFDLISQTGEQLRKKLGIQSMTPQEAAEVAVTLPGNRIAAQLYSEGIEKLRSFDALAARDLLQKVIAIEPSAALPHSALATAWSKLGYDSAAVAEAKQASDLSASLPSPERSLVQGRYQEVSRNWNKAIQTYGSLFRSYPDNIDYGLALANAQVVGAKWNDALTTITLLRNLPAPLNADPRIDWQEGRAARSLGDMKRAEAAFAAAIKKTEASGATLLMARALVDDAMALEDLGSFDRVDAPVQRAKQLYQSAHDLQGVAVATTNQASMLASQGDSLGALKNYEQSFAIYKSIGDKAGLAGEEVNIASVLLNEDNLNGARIHNERARNLYREIGEPDGVALAEAALGETLLASGRLLDAKQRFEDSRQICIGTGNRIRQAEALSGLSEVLRIEGDAENASRDIAEAQTIFAQSGEELEKSRLDLYKAELLLDEVENLNAEQLSAQALGVFTKSRSAYEEAMANVVLSKSLFKEKRFVEAKEHSERASAIASKSNFRALELDAAILDSELHATSTADSSRAEAINALRNVIVDAQKAGYIPQEFEARLALGEMELASGKQHTGIEELSRLQKDAANRGWQLIAHKAQMDFMRTRQ